MSDRSPNNFAAVITFVIVMVLFGSANLWTFMSVPECCDQFDYFGFPLSFLQRGGIAEVLVFSPLKLALDVLIALLAAGSAAWFVRRP